ncbi:MAG: mechanosensitive ion channel family protein [Ktedonobacterales bacterium]
MGGIAGQLGALLSMLNGTGDVWKYVLPAAIVAGITIGGRIAEFILRRRLGALARKTGWRGDTAIVRALRNKITISSLLLGIAVALNYLPWQLTGTQLDLIHKILLVGFLIVLIMLATDMVSSLLLFSHRAERHPAVSIVDTLVRATIYVIGAIIILQQVFNYNLAPALAALGVAGLAVSLALQSTLTDFISGIQIIVARQIRPGEYIKLSTGEEGYVTDIGWRTTTIRQLSNNLVIIPNSKMTSTILVNYYSPDTSMAILVNVGVRHDSDLVKVERVTVEVAKEVLGSVAGGVLDSDPFIRYNEVGESSINFTVILRGKEYADQYLITHEFIKRLIARYREEQIHIASPVRSVQLHSGDAGAGQELVAEPAHSGNSHPANG